MSDASWDAMMGANFGSVGMTADDLIRRGDAMEACTEQLGNMTCLASNPPQSSAAWDARNAIAALPAAPVGVRVKPDRETFDAMCAMRDSINEHIPMPSLESDLLQGPENSVFCATVGEAVISEVLRLRNVVKSVNVKQLEWHNFDAWTHWAEGACGTYHVEERNGYWQVELRVGGLIHHVTKTDDTMPDDLEAAKAAAQADYEARIMAALTPDPADEVRRAALLRCLESIRELNMTAEDESGHRWANSDLIEQELVTAIALIKRDTK